MATQLDVMPDGNPYKRHYRLYPWDEWMNGQPWQIKRGEDFACSTVNMRSNIYSRALRTGRQVKIVKDMDTLTFQFGPAA